jgi:2-keto-4-pentenoate hydratase
MISEAAQRLRTAARTGVPCAPVRDLVGDVRAAYDVQQEQTAARLAEGRRVVGAKIGLTSPAVQAQLGVDSPDFGVLFDDMARSEAEPIDTAGLLQPRIEAEVAFVLAADITDPDRAADSVAYAVAALEIVDSRIAGWDITLPDTVADNASSALFVLGARPVPLADLVPADVTMALTVDGTEVSTGTGKACLGDPLLALAWLARTSVANGQPLRAGQVVLSGALGPMVPVTPGIVVVAEISGLGTVRARFA